ncbi:hypothetical protein BH09ACT8_BH09ACT8_56370 [soil metagenome]
MALTQLLAPIGPGLVVSEDAIQDPTRPKHLEWARFVRACDGFCGDLPRTA